MFRRAECCTKAFASGASVFPRLRLVWGRAPSSGTDTVITSSAHSVTQPHDGQCQSSATHHTGLDGRVYIKLFQVPRCSTKFTWLCTCTLSHTIFLADYFQQLGLYLVVKCIFMNPLNLGWFHSHCVPVFSAFLQRRDARAVADWLVVLLQRDALWSPCQHGHERNLLNIIVSIATTFLFVFSK